MKTNFESTVFNLPSLEATGEWVQQTFKVKESDIKVTEVDATKTTLSWNADPNSLHLWYPDQGRVIALNNAQANKLTGQMLVANAIMVNSTNVADMWPVVYPGSQYPIGRSVLRPWPGDINQLVVDE